MTTYSKISKTPSNARDMKSISRVEAPPAPTLLVALGAGTLLAASCLRKPKNPALPSGQPVAATQSVQQTQPLQAARPPTASDSSVLATPDSADTTGPDKPLSSDTQALAAREPRRSEGEYDPALWEHWVDADEDCRDTRTEVLLQESEVVVTMDETGCEVLSGRWTCPYSLNVFENPNDLAIDHLIPLQHAARQGAESWNQEQRQAFANELDSADHLTAVWSETKRAKGSKGLEEWLPDRISARCQYVDRWSTIKKAWKLEVSSTERKIARRYRKLCERGIDLPSPQTVADLEVELRARESGKWNGETASGRCCRHCSSGKPCGNSCIARSKTCRSSPGCACY